MTKHIDPTPGDPSTEPVATPTESHNTGRVGPPTIAQDANADWHQPEGIDQIKPGTILPADYPATGGPLPDPAADKPASNG